MKRVKFVLNDNEIKEGILEEDNMFWGGFKIIYENSILAINLVTIIEEPEINIK